MVAAHAAAQAAAGLSGHLRTGSGSSGSFTAASRAGSMSGARAPSLTGAGGVSDGSVFSGGPGRLVTIATHRATRSGGSLSGGHLASVSGASGQAGWADYHYTVGDVADLGWPPAAIRTSSSRAASGSGVSRRPGHSRHASAGISASATAVLVMNAAAGSASGMGGVGCPAVSSSIGTGRPPSPLGGSPLAASPLASPRGSPRVSEQVSS